jgi:hypothetical protein
MGVVLSLLKGGPTESQPIDIPIDFNGNRQFLISASPTSAETEYAAFQEITAAFPKWISVLEQYTGCGEFIRQVSI